MPVTPSLSAFVDSIWSFHDNFCTQCLFVLNACLLPSLWGVAFFFFFNKSPQPCVHVCVWKTQIKSPQCEMYLHPWHLDVIYPRGFPRAQCGSHLTKPYHWCQAWDFYSETSLQRQRALWVKRKTMAIKTTECTGSLMYIINNCRKATNSLTA